MDVSHTGKRSPVHNRHVGTEPEGLKRKLPPHPAGRPGGEDPDVIERLSTCPARDQDTPSRKRSSRESAFGVEDDHIAICDLCLPFLDPGGDDIDTPGAEPLEVLRDTGVAVHALMHRRRYHDRHPPPERRRRKRRHRGIVDPAGDLSDGVCRSRRDEQEIGGPALPAVEDMFHKPRDPGDHRPPGRVGQGVGMDDPGRRPGHDRLDLCTPAAQGVGELHRLHGRYTPGHRKDNRLS